ncbi:MAG: tetratricopeptide repeat protein [Acidobacteria bacterium]|nr:tetratricopeptide repeat protein [Acidobacteriota bacterium]
MKYRSVLFGLLICLLPAPAPGQGQTVTGSLESVISMEDPAARIDALQKMIKTTLAPEEMFRAREAIAASWAQMGEIQLGKNNIEKAVAHFQKALALLPEELTDRFFSATVIRIPQAISARGYRQEAISLARQLEKRFAKEPLRLAGIGEYYLTIEAPDDAIRALETAVNLAGKDARIHRSLGAAYRVGLRLGDSIYEYQQAINLDPGDKRAYYELGNLYRALGVYADAIKFYTKQLEIEPGHSPSHKGMALAYLALGNEAKAKVSLSQARGRGPEEEITRDIYLQTQLAFYYLRLNKIKEARYAAESALVVEPRYAWARIVNAEVDLAEGKYFDAERNLIAAQRYAGFPTLFFTFGRLYLAVEDFEGALEQFGKAFNYSLQKKFTARLGGVFEAQADDLQDLFAREYQAAIFLAEPPVSKEQYKIAESLVSFNYNLSLMKIKQNLSRDLGKPAPNPRQIDELRNTAVGFRDAEMSRRPFRALYLAQRLGREGVGLEFAVEQAEMALGMAEIATELDGSLRDYPNYDRQGRLRIFRGRALDAKGWALFKLGRNRESHEVLSAAALAYGPLSEGKLALRHLATVKELFGQLREALDLYIAAYEPPAANLKIDVNRSLIEGLYRRLYGSLVGLDERLRSASEAPRADTSTLMAAIKSTQAEPNGSPPASTPPSADQIEPAMKQPAESNDKQSKSLPQLTRSPAELSTGTSIDPPQPAKTSTDQKRQITKIDSIFTTRAPPPSPSPKKSDAKVDPVTTEETRVVDLPVAKTAVEMPQLNPKFDPTTYLTPFQKGRELYIPRETVTISVNEQVAPAPAAAPAPSAQRPRLVNTRKRRVLGN